MRRDDDNGHDLVVVPAAFVVSSWLSHCHRRRHLSLSCALLSSWSVSSLFGMTLHELKEPEKARATFEQILRIDPEDKATKAALAALQAKIKAAEDKENKAPKEPEVPMVLQNRLQELRHGQIFRRTSFLSPKLDDMGPSAILPADWAASLRLNLRSQLMLEEFYRQALAVVLRTAGIDSTTVVVCGAGTYVAAPLCAALADRGYLKKATVVEPSVLMGEWCREIAKVKCVRSSGQLDNGFAFPAAVFEPPMQIMLLLPSGVSEVVSAEPSDTGLMILMKMLPLKQKHGLPQEMEILLPDGNELQMSMKLEQQNVRSGCVLTVRAKGEETNSDVSPLPSSFNLSSPQLLLVCDRISDDLLGERLVTTMGSARDAAEQHAPQAQVHCVPSRAALLCTPIALSDRCSDFDISQLNAFRYTASDEVEQVVAKPKKWECNKCNMQNEQWRKECQVCSGKKPTLSVKKSRVPRKSHAWCPVDLDAEVSKGGTCTLCCQESVLAVFDFDNSAAFNQQRRMATKQLKLEVTQAGRMNGMAVWWQLNTGTAVTSNRPNLAGAPEDSSVSSAGRMQAVYHFGFDLAVVKGETLIFDVKFHDSLSKMTFDLVSPKLQERMGLVKFEVKVEDLRIIDELATKMDLKTSRLTAPIHGTELMPGDFEKQIEL